MPISQYTISQFIVDAFTDTVFKGNPAAVCLLDEWLSDNTLQNIAKETISLRQLLLLKRTAITIYVGLLPVEKSICVVMLL